MLLLKPFKFLRDSTSEHFTSGILYYLNANIYGSNKAKYPVKGTVSGGLEMCADGSGGGLVLASLSCAGGVDIENPSA